MKEFKRYDINKLKDMIYGLGQYTNLSVSNKERCKIHICGKYDNNCSSCMFSRKNNINSLDCNDTLGSFSSSTTFMVIKRLKEILRQSEIKEYRKFKLER